VLRDKLFVCFFCLCSVTPLSVPSLPTFEWSGRLRSASLCDLTSFSCGRVFTPLFLPFLCAVVDYFLFWFLSPDYHGILHRGIAFRFYFVCAFPLVYDGMVIREYSIRSLLPFFAFFYISPNRPSPLQGTARAGFFSSTVSVCCLLLSALQVLCSKRSS